MAELTRGVGEFLLTLKSEPFARTITIVIALAFLILSFALVFITKQGHCFVICFAGIVLLAWIGGYRMGLVAGLLVPIAAVPTSLSVGVPLDHVLRDTVGFLFIALVSGGSVGILSTVFGYVVTTQRELRMLYEFLPICSYCRNICDDENSEEWVPLEVFLSRHTKTQLSHGICPQCRREVEAREM